MDLVSVSPIHALGEAYCKAEHGGHASGSTCDFGVRRARRIMAMLPDNWRLVDALPAEPAESGVDLLTEAEAFLSTMSDVYWASDQITRAHAAITRFERVLIELRPRPQRDPLQDAADARDDQRPGGYVSRRPA